MSELSTRFTGFFGKRDYRGADMDMVRRISAAVALLTGAVGAALAPLAPVGEQLGPAGWAAFTLVVGAFVVTGLRLLRAERIGASLALAVHYGGVAAVALLVWLSDGRQSPYMTLFLLWLILAAAAHPPRRTFAFMGATAVLVILPLFYDDWSGVFAGDLIVRLMTWNLVALLACVWTTGVRVERISLVAEEERSSRLARLDPLTGLRNRRAFDERVEREIERAAATRTPLSVVVADLDDFKVINDSYGHLNGDQCLRDAAAALSAAVRDQDLCYRWGGDEFAVLLPNVDQHAARRVAERMSASVVTSCERPDGSPLTLAWGAAELTPGMQPADLLTAADLALMTRKHERTADGRFRAGAPDPDAT